MNKNNTRLIEEVAKLVVNLLTKDGGVYLPSIGSLTLRSDESGRSVIFSDEERHGSIVGVIASRGNCSMQKAQKIYDKWLSVSVSESGDVLIHNVGKIEGGVFTISKVLADRFSPVPPTVEKRVATSGRKSAKSKKGAAAKQGSNRSTLYVVGVIVALVALVVFLRGLNEGEDVEVITVESDVIVVDEAAVVSQVEVVESVELSQAEVVAPAPKKSKVNKITSKARLIGDDVAKSVLSERLISSGDSPLRFRVVCGVLLSPANAGRLILDVEERTDFEVKVFERSGGYMITVYESDGFRPCVNFIKDQASKYYDYTWVYDEKTM